MSRSPENSLAVYMAVATVAFKYLLAYGAPEINAILALLRAVNGSLAHFCSWGGVKIDLAVQRDFLTQKGKFVFKDTDAGHYEAGAACNLYCSESSLWLDFMELDIMLLFLANGFDLLLHLLHIR